MNNNYIGKSGAQYTFEDLSESFAGELMPVGVWYISGNLLGINHSHAKPFIVNQSGNRVLYHKCEKEQVDKIVQDLADCNF